MKKLLSITFLLLCLMVVTSCYKETDYNWVDSTTHIFDYWGASRVNIFYVNADNEALFNISDATKCPVVTDKSLTDAEVDSVRKTLTYVESTNYGVSATTTGNAIINAEGATVGFIYYDSYYLWPCLIPYCHVNNTGSTSNYIYTIGSDNKVCCDTLVAKYHYAQEDDHWLVEATKMTLNGEDVWAKGGNDVGVVCQK